MKWRAATAFVFLCVSPWFTGQVIGSPHDEEPNDGEPRDSGITERVEVRSALPEGDDVAAFATRLETDEVSQRGEDLAEVLRRVPGARVRDYGGLGSYATLSLRASTAEQVTVLVDGVPQNRALGGPVDIGSIPATQVESVTVFRGFAPASYGLGGIGGLVDVRTRQASDEHGVQVDLLAGTLDSQRVSSSAALPAGGGDLRLGVEALHSQGDYLYYDGGATPFDPGDDAIRRRQNNEIRKLSLVARQSWNRVGSGRLGLGLRLDRHERGVPGLGNFQSETAETADSLGELRVSWNRGAWGALDGLDLLVDGFRNKLRFNDPNGELGTVQDRRTRLTGGGGTAVLRGDAGRHRLLGRLELRRESADVEDPLRLGTESAGAKRGRLIATFEDIVSFGRFSVAPSLRWEMLRDERFGVTGIRNVDGDYDNTALSGKIGLAYVIDRGLRVRGSAGKFHRNPSLLELFGDTGAVKGNPRLLPESGESAEVGFDWSREQRRLAWNLELVGFARNVEDLIWIVQNSQATSIAQNIASAEIRGVESSMGLRWPWGFGLEGSVTWQSAVDSSPGGFVEGRPLQFHPDLLGYAGLRFERAGVLVRWEVTYVGENSTTQFDAPAFNIPARIVHDLNLAYRWRNGLRVGLDVRNVFDRQILDLMRYPLPSRVIFLHLGWRPGRPV